jgi:hypothetical protein
MGDHFRRVCKNFPHLVPNLLSQFLVVIFFVRQKGPDIDVPSGLLPISRLGIVDDGDRPVSILPEVEDRVPVDIIGICKHAANFQKFVPPDSFDYRRPSFDFVCRIRIAMDGFVQMPSGDDIHPYDDTSQLVKYQ